MARDAEYRAEDCGADELADDLLDELRQVFAQRGETYRLLSRLYLEEASDDLLGELHGMLYPVDSGDADMDTGYLYLATFLSNLWSESVSELKVDYTRCFLGHGVDGYSAAYPYESVYTSEKRLTMQKARDEVLAVYAQAGITKSELWKEGEDHLALELDFEGIMGDRTVAALASGNQAHALELVRIQYDFLKQHLLNWTPMLTADMRAFARTKFYQGLSYLTDGFLRTDREFLESVVEVLSADGKQV